MKPSYYLTMISVLMLGVTIASCSGTPKVRYNKVSNLQNTVIGEGYAWGDDAEQKATAAAVLEATVLSVPRSVEFNFLKVDGYEMFKTEKVEYTETKILATEKLPDGGVRVTVEGKRSSQSMRAMRFMNAAHFTITSRLPTFKERVEQINLRLFDKALKHFAIRNYGEVPEKLKGNFTFFKIERQDDGISKMEAKVCVFAGTGKGALTKQEKGMVLMNAWRAQCANGKGEKASPVFQKAIKIYPNSAFNEEYAMFEMSQNRFKNAINALTEATKISPHEVKYYKILYQLYKKTENQPKMDTMQAQLEELEAWDENPGEDITSGFRYRTKIKWSDGSNENEKEGMIHFRDADLEEDE